MKLSGWLFLFVLIGIGTGSERGVSAQTPTPNAGETLPAPVLVWPSAGAAMHADRRLIDFKWAEVAGASSYTVEIDSFRCTEKGGWCSDDKRTGYLVRGVETPELFFNFCCSTPGRWRVWASGASGEGAKSEWREFTIANPPGAKTEPPVPPFDRPLPPTDCAWRSSLAHPEPGTVPPYITFAPEPKNSESGGRINGVVVLEVKVGAEGSVEDLCLLNAPRADLAEAAIRTVKTWRYEPANKSGVKVPAVAHLEIRFRACCDEAVLMYPPKQPVTQSSPFAMPKNSPCASWMTQPAPGTVPPRAIYSPDPQYSAAASKMKLSGEVGLVLKIDAAGFVEDVCVAKSLPADLDEAAASTLKNWRFEPARKDGVAVPYATYVSVTFKLY